MEKKNPPKEFEEWINEKWGTEKLPVGGVVPYQSSYGYKTGDWSAYKAYINKEKCIGCLNCFFYCPDSAITMDENNKAEADFDFCKGCGVCAQHCPVDAIEMKSLR
ncbi:MAG: 4Fe-4S binding protein [Candidatus Heimdallarchaeaceae archaeon]